MSTNNSFENHNENLRDKELTMKHIGLPRCALVSTTDVNLLLLASSAGAAKTYFRYLLRRRFSVLKLHVTAS